MAELVIAVEVELLMVDVTASVVTAGVVVTVVVLVLVNSVVVVVAPLAVVEGGTYSCAGKHVTLRLPEAKIKVTSYDVSALPASVVT